MRIARFSVLLFTAVAILCLASCKKSSSEVPVFEKEFPDMVMSDATYTLYKDNAKPVTMSAENITVYSSSQRAVFDNVSFNQDENVTGKSTTATVLDNSRISLSNGIIIEKASDNVKIECDSLEWNNSTGSVSATGNLHVSCSEDSSINADSLKTNLNETTYRFENIGQARFTAQDETEIGLSCNNLYYDSGNETVMSDTAVRIEDVSRNAVIKGARLVYDKKSGLMTLSLQSQFEKETDNGLLTCTSESMVYNTNEQKLTIIGNAHVVWNNDSYRASMIIIDLNTEKVTLIGPITGEIYG